MHLFMFYNQAAAHEVHTHDQVTAMQLQEVCTTSHMTSVLNPECAQYTVFRLEYSCKTCDKTSLPLSQYGYIK